ncbi:MAG: glutamine-hydrolyzing carbamoyl-phosphate synthase small subunit [Clostridia bacterium]|nr:glutamine-hydrolyzing carbamoyl-phosphate synthase small subunit [Clostridia bacterium]
MLTDENKKLVFEDGTVFYGYSFGSETEKILEIVFNTSPVGYQEILSDPSYTDQAVCMTYPLIGNYGMAADDYETDVPTIGALIVREYNDIPSNFRSEHTLGEIMKKYDIAGISGVDTRAITRIIRDKGSSKVLLTAADTPESECAAKLAGIPLPHDSVSRVSHKGFREFPADNHRLHIVAFDCGIKQNIIRSLNSLGCSVTSVPWNTGFDEVKTMNPDGVFLSNGPGDPEDVAELIQTVKKIAGNYPVFGICLGHQILSLAYGARTYKLKFGHRGGNHPVKNIITGRTEITSQNHSYAVNPDSVAGTPLTVTHINLLDNTVEGVMCESDRVFGVQYHPESAPGPQDSGYLFDCFINMIEGGGIYAQKN